MLYRAAPTIIEVMNGTENMDVHLQAVMGIAGVEGTQTVTNNVMESWDALGIEAARSKIIEQIDMTMSSHGMTIDTRHTMLLADCMTYKVSIPQTHPIPPQWVACVV